MVENLGRKLTLIAVLLTLAIVSFIVAKPRMGLDLQGGTRLVYHVDFERALEDHLITEDEAQDSQELVRQIIKIIRERIDPQGVLEPQIRPEGSDRIVIELPGAGGEASEPVVGRLQAPIEAGMSRIELVDEGDVLRGFPSGGGVVEIEGELVRYESREGSLLRVARLGRGFAASGAEPHAAGVEVRLSSTDPITPLIENTGDLQFYIKASSADFEALGTDEQKERDKVEAWMAANPDATTLVAYNRLAPPEGPPERLLWFTFAAKDDAEPEPLAQRQPTPMIVQENKRWHFSGDDLESVFPAQDKTGFPAVGFAMRVDRQGDFGSFTEKHIDEPMAIVISGEIATMPNINDRLPGSGVIEGGMGGFTSTEVNDLVTVLRSGSLKIKPKLEHQERVGATLGEKYVQRGFISFVLGLVVVIAFMLAYYRRLGVFGAISLLANLVLLMGALSFLQATLTLPGMAGIILTIGMAVDANILIYERIREEGLRGRKPMQAAKDGFSNALSAIIDANVTTLITAAILYKFGTGPVRGFATTLAIGIITSVFSALVITRVLVHLQLERGIERFSMLRLVAETKFRFMARAKAAAAISVVLILAGLALFAALDDRDKLSIDFLGGMTMTVRTQEPQSFETMQSAVQGIEGMIGESAEVKAILASGTRAGGFNQFRVTFKTEGGAGSGDGIDQGQDQIKTIMEGKVVEALGPLGADVLERGPREILVTAGEGRGEVAGTLYFEEPHPVADVEAALAEIPIEGVAGKIEKVEGPTAAYRFAGTVGLDKDQRAVEDLVSAKFKGRRDSNGTTFAWATPIPEVHAVGAQVVTELRDNAVFSILLSLFLVVLYLRVRFAEYSYGLAAVVAVVHDVLITLGALSVALRFDLVDAEISLPMIAAFLTIIGYSLNDTIVIFDRIRENLPRMKGSMTEIVDISINQTLSRTILTTATTLLVVLILLAFNWGSRNVLEGFSFALVIGMIAGTYSTVFIATPVLVWLEQHRLKNLGDGEKGSAKAKKPQHEPQVAG